jgi:hypothetical protein
MQDHLQLLFCQIRIRSGKKHAAIRAEICGGAGVFELVISFNCVISLAQFVDLGAGN